MATLPVHIRRGAAADAAALAEFAARTYAATFGHATQPDDLAAYLEQHYGVRQQQEELSSSSMITLVAEHGETPAGFAQVRHHAPPPCVAGDAPVELWRFYVDRPWHGSGLAQRLMESVRAVASEVGGRTLWLSVWEANHRAIRFYEKCGFEDVGSHPFLVGTDRQTDRIMALAIGEPEPRSGAGVNGS